MSKTTSRIIKAESNFNIILETLPTENHIVITHCQNHLFPKWDFHNRIISDFHIAFVRDGMGSYYLKNCEEPMEKGKIYFFSSNYPHSRITDEFNLPKITMVRFRFVNNSTNEDAIIDYTPFAFAYITDNIAKYNGLFTQLADSYMNNSSQTNLVRKYCNAQITLLIYEIYKDILKIITPKDVYDARLEKATTYIKNNPCIEISIDELADIAGMSKNYFRSEFRKHYGISPKKYIIKNRVKLAAMILAESDKTVKQVSEIMGYPDPFTFSKQFKSVMGVSPSDIFPRRS